MLLIALPLLLLALPYLNRITQADIKLSIFSDYRLWLMLAGTCFYYRLVAGSYPAFYLSAFQAIKVIKGNFTTHVSAAGIRSSLVVFQFVLSIVLIAGIIIIYSQLNYINNKDLGFEKNQRLIFNFYTEDAKSKMPAFMNDLRQMADVKAVSKSNNYLSQFVAQDYGVYLAGGSEATATDAQNITTDEYFAKANGIKIISGRDFRLHDSGKVLINETLHEAPWIKAGKSSRHKIIFSLSRLILKPMLKIAGVMKDFNYNSLHDDVKPFMLVYNPGRR